jgi:hypothetical protein
VNTVAAILLCSWCPCLILWAVVLPLAREYDDEDQADKPAGDGNSDLAPCWAPGSLAAAPPDTGRVTLPAPPAPVRLVAPRVSAGRVTVPNLIRWAYALADYPVPAYSSAPGTFAQEVAA